MAAPDCLQWQTRHAHRRTVLQLAKFRRYGFMFAGMSWAFAFGLLCGGLS